MRRILLGLAAALCVIAPARAEPPVWVVRDADSELVLFGSIHVLPPALAWRPAALNAALAKADDLWFELPSGPEAEEEIARLAATTGILPPGKSLFALLSAQDATRLAKVAEAYGADKAMLDRLEPWLAEVALSAAAYGRAGAETRYGVEATLSAAAPPSLRREALETPAEQLGLFDSTPLKEQLASLSETIRELDEDPQSFQKLLRAWLDADVGTIDREALQPLRAAAPEVFRRLVTERNARWTKALEARLKGKGRTVVVVGVGHLVGSGGLPARLRSLGYSVAGP